MTETPSCTAFFNDRLLATGAPWDVALAIKQATLGDASTVLVFDDRTGRQIDFDLRGSDDEIAERLRGPDSAPAAGRSRGRPKLGVIAREVTLLPRHWDWLAQQPEGASAAIRRLIDAARAKSAEADQARQARSAADRFMMAMLGNQPGWEDASRALYAGDAARFHALTEPWPTDLRDYARRLAEAAFTAQAHSPSSVAPRQ
ncbi:DUF2239 family protein [Azospirillum soli]|uniref:DUF2239 family protein n=1 Tax=Azospirillum soli TaxID=1304799 RepID=UPI001AE0FBFD|nr:hypothetical protein [Azospirillum soli]